MPNPIEPSKTALLIIDMQIDAVTAAGISADRGTWQHEKAQGAIAHIRALASAARKAGVRVIHVHHVRYDDERDGPTNAPLFAALAESGGFIDGAPNTQAVPPLRPARGDIVVKKTRVSAFHGSDLEIKLTGLGISKLIVTGTWTNFSVESTCRYGADAGYEMVLVRDATCTMGEEWQTASTDYALTQLVEMLETADILSALDGKA